MGAPQALTASVDGNIVELRWQPPVTGDAPVGYLIEAGSAPGRIDLATLRVGSGLTFATSIQQGEYHVRVRAISAGGLAGEASNEIVVRR
jgi:hypothetical protein